MEFKETAHSENIDEIVLAENSYRTIHKLIKSGCGRCIATGVYQYSGKCGEIYTGRRYNTLYGIGTGV